MRKRWVILFVVLLALVLGWFVGNYFLRPRGYGGTGDFLGQITENYPKSFSAEPFTLSIQVDDDAYNQLEEVVLAARERGVIMPEGNDYVPASLNAGGNDFKGKIRVKGKLTDHVKGDKWSFRILGRKGGAFNGMQRFSIQHPGTRNYLYEWLYHRLMAREGVIALRYGFVDVTFNGEPLGIYAYEEHFGQELLQNNHRVPGPIFRFDPGLYWIRRLNEMKDLRFREAYADHHAAMLDSYDSGDIYKSEKRTAEFGEALQMMNALRSGLASASDVLDTDKVALRHALIDLIGGHHSMDWSDVKFYYDPVAKIIEPLAYESFSVRPLKQLAGSFRYQGRAQSRLELHDIFFNDERLFRQYVGHLERVSSLDYLDSLFAEIQTELDSVSAILYKEFPYKPLDKALYYKNAEVIRATLDLPKGVHAYVSATGKGKIALQLVPISDLPVEIHRVLVNDKVLNIDSTLIVKARRQGHLGKPVSLVLDLPDSLLAMYKDIRVEWSILGASTRKMAGVVPMEYPNEEEFASLKRMPEEVDWSLFPMLDLHEETKELLLKGGEHELVRDLFIPEGYTFLASGLSTLNIADGVSIIVEGKLNWGTAIAQQLQVNMLGNGQIILRNTRQENRIEHTTISRLKDDESFRPVLLVVNSTLSFSATSIRGMKESDLVLFSSSTLRSQGLHIESGNDLLHSYFSELSGNWYFRDAKDDAISIHGGRMSSGIGADRGMLRIQDIQGVGVKLDAGAKFEMNLGAISDCSTACRVRNGSRLSLSGITIENCGRGITTDRSDLARGDSCAELDSVDFVNVQIRFEQGAGSSIKVNGKERSNEKKAGT